MVLWSPQVLAGDQPWNEKGRTRTGMAPLAAVVVSAVPTQKVLVPAAGAAVFATPVAPATARLAPAVTPELRASFAPAYRDRDAEDLESGIVLLATRKR